MTHQMIVQSLGPAGHVENRNGTEAWQRRRSCLQRADLLSCCRYVVGGLWSSKQAKGQGTYLPGP